MDKLFGLFIPICLTLLISSCGDNELDNLEVIPTYELSLNSLLDESGSSLLVDSNGYYRLTLDSLSNTKQTVRRITGTILKNGKEPRQSKLIKWESSHNWITNNDSSYVIRRIINTLGRWVIVDTIQLNIPSGLTVPTINSSSYSGTNGQINTMIAPIYEMKGDTLTVTAEMWTRTQTYNQSLKVILE